MYIPGSMHWYLKFSNGSAGDAASTFVFKYQTTLHHLLKVDAETNAITFAGDKIRNFVWSVSFVISCWILFKFLNKYGSEMHGKGIDQEIVQNWPSYGQKCSKKFQK